MYRYIIKNLDSSTPIEIIRMFLDRGADPYEKNKNDNISLHHAKSIEIIALFLEHGADINAKNIFDSTPLQLIKKTNNAVMVRFF
jgi:ankyrin repeat protein